MTVTFTNRVIEKVSSTALEGFSPAPIHKLFEAQVRSTPDPVAVVCEQGQLSYRELNERANQLAHHLRKLGVGPESLVGISVERSLEMIIGLFGILKAGGAYLPLDPAYPAERLAFMIEDARPAALIVRRRSTNVLQHGVPTVCLDTDWELIAKESRENPPSDVCGSNLAYVMYTSGSTGAPKGVMIEHRSLVNYSEAAADEYAIGPGDRMLQFASISFDASAEEIYTILTRGGTLVLRNEAMLGSIYSFLETCGKWGITILDLPTAYWHRMVERLALQDLPLPESLRLVIIGGERALPERVSTWRRQIGDRVRLVNTYGPTEATIAATQCDLTRCPIESDAHEVPIGRAIRNAQTYIFDSQLNPVAPGVSGELYIGGVGVARGYLNRPDLTEARFITDPFSLEPQRLYRTGDLARYLPNGNIEFCGRVDNQVKINGFRIEPGEIESAIARHPAVREVAVLARPDGSGDSRLSAYVVPASDPSTSDRALLVRELRSFLGTALPQHMMPSAFVVVPGSLPLNANGKLDREHLSRLNGSTPVSSDGHVRARDPLEYQLRQIWEDLFDSGPIGVTDDFFELGGHSLLWVRMMDRIEEVFGRTLQLGTLFRGATIEYLADALKRQTVADSSPVVAIQREGVQSPFYYLHGDFNGGGLYCINLARHLGKDRPFYAVQPHGCDGRMIRHSIEAMAEDHVNALRELQPRGPYLLGGHCNGGLIAFEMARQLNRQGQAVDQLVLICAIPASRRYGSLKTAVNRYCRMRQLAPEKSQEVFLRLRAYAIRLDEIHAYYAGQLREASKLRIRDRISFAADKGFSGVKLLARLMRRRPPADQAASADAVPIATLTPNELRRREINDAYEKAIASYIPGRYSGRMTMLQPSEWMQGHLSDPTSGWREFAPNVEVRVVPGGHLSCITQHVEELAGCLRDSLSRFS